jgi:hypothetical protein
MGQRARCFALPADFNAPLLPPELLQAHECFSNNLKVGS